MADLVWFLLCLPNLRAEGAAPSAPSTCISESGIEHREEGERLREELGQNARVPALPQPPLTLPETVSGYCPTNTT